MCNRACNQRPLAGSPHIQRGRNDGGNRMRRTEIAEWAEVHGYVRYVCPVHGPFWSDSGPRCERCPDEDEEDDEGEESLR